MGHPNDIWNAHSALLNARDRVSAMTIISSGLDAPKFFIIESEFGSYKAVVGGISEVFVWAGNRLGSVFAVFTGQAKRLGEAHTAKTEAEAGIERERWKQESLRTLSKAMELAKAYRDEFGNESGGVLSAGEKRELSNQFILPAIERIGEVLSEKNLSMQIAADDD